MAAYCRVLLLFALFAFAVACAPPPAPPQALPTTAGAATPPVFTATPPATETVAPTRIPSPTATAAASETSVPAATATPVPSATPVPTRILTPLPTATPRPVEVTLWHAQGQQQHTLLAALAERFNATHPEIHVTVTYLPVYADLIKPGANAPDMVLAYQTDLEPLARKGTLIALDDLMQDNAIGWSARDLADIFPAFIDRYPRAGNKVYSLGFMRTMQVMFYNAEVLVAANAGVPQNWEDFNTICAAVSKPPDRYCYEMAADASTFAGWIWSRGGNLVAPDAKSVAFDQKAGLDSLTWLGNLYQKRQALTANRPFQLPADFATGKAVFTFDTVTGLSAYDRAVKSTVKPFAWGIAPPPRTTAEPFVDVYGPGVAIYKTTTEKQRAAFVFVKWLMDPLPNADWVTVTGYMPARASTGAALVDYFKANPAYALAFTWLRYGRAEPALAAWAPLRGLLADAMSAVAGGQVAPDAALKDAAKKANDALAGQ